jgi:DNA-binding NtrC family response regulator
VLCHVDLLNASAQDRLFEHLEHRERARVIATTTADLGEMTAMRRFRQDLFYRLNGIHLESPPLRQRREDIPLLVQHWLRFWSASRQIPCPQLSAAALKHLIGHEWPGNVGELQAMVEEICGRMDSGVIHPFHLPSTYRRKTSGTRSLSSW